MTLLRCQVIRRFNKLPDRLCSAREMGAFFSLCATILFTDYQCKINTESHQGQLLPRRCTQPFETVTQYHLQNLLGSTTQPVQLFKKRKKIQKQSPRIVNGFVIFVWGCIHSSCRTQASQAHKLDRPKRVSFTTKNMCTYTKSLYGPIESKPSIPQTTILPVLNNSPFHLFCNKTHAKNQMATICQMSASLDN